MSETLESHIVRTLTKEERETDIPDLDGAVPCEHTKPEGVEWDSWRDRSCSPEVYNSLRQRGGGEGKTPIANCGIVSPQKNNTTILFLNDRAYTLKHHSHEKKQARNISTDLTARKV